MFFLSSLTVTAFAENAPNLFNSGYKVLPEDATFSERLMSGLETAAVGIGIVFAILVILMIVLYLFKLVFAGKSYQQVIDVQTKKINTNHPAEQTFDADIVSDKAVAALSSAIAAYRGDSDLNFDIVSIKKIK